MTWLLSVVIKPIVLLIMLSIAAVPRWLVARFMRDGRLKRLLLRRSS